MSSRKRPAAPAGFPGFLEPAKPNLLKVAPYDEKWIHEVKFDGYRIQAGIHASEVTLWTRNGYDYTIAS
ncbi:ATP-dependent DNA ligase [Variibacter gotjawalensis]|uniref:ATP-dependent DNA ligase n=1 Tax=Variibacter gotjawalensis TaxID=1333996 RepID=A0A0S3PX41_9BRAD|nr:hypothetical protein [Variibacter gotjawalensis]NIK46316.1 ATP-dependent DNA ligase [Variibacter gotjawalensis]BAT60487.1 ATP-dependent DNA ligase [Variibacter gotjawalensis]